MPLGEDTLDVFVIYSPFCLATCSTTLHFLDGTVWKAAHGPDCLPDAEHPQLQLL